MTLSISLTENNDILITSSSRQHLTVHGQRGNDHIETGTGNDFVDGGTGHDFVKSEGGWDILLGGEGNDNIIFGTPGTSLLRGDVGILSGGEGDDYVFAIDAGLAFLEGGNGNDYLTSFAVQSFLDGGTGNDVIRASASSLVMGGIGADIFQPLADFTYGKSTTMQLMDFNPLQGDRLDLSYLGYNTERNFAHPVARESLVMGDTGTLYVVQGSSVHEVHGVEIIGAVGIDNAISMGWLNLDLSYQKG